MTVVCSGASSATMTLPIDSSTVGLPGAQGWQEVLLIPPTILMDAIRGVARFMHCYILLHVDTDSNI